MMQSGVSRWRGGSLVVASAVVIVAVTLFAGIAARTILLPTLERTADGRLSSADAALDARIARYAYLPDLLARSAEIQAVVTDPSVADAANRSLELTASSAGAGALFVLDRDGTTLAASNWREETSFVGRNYGFRPYYRDAVAGRPGRYYAVGVTTRVAGYFLSAPVRRGDAVVGVVVVKIDLAPLEEEWARSGDRIAVVAEDDVVLLSSVPDWRYRRLLPHRGGTGETDDDQRYADLKIGNEPILAAPPADLAPQTIRLGTGVSEAALVRIRAVPEHGWRVVYAADVSGVDVQVAQVAVATALAGALTTALVAFGVQRGRARRAEREALVLLDRRVRERTGELAEANARLEAEIIERGKAEADLHRTRDALVQSAKLAALGQTLAGFAHELNQPLAALRTYLASARLLITKGRTDEAVETVTEMAETIDRLRDLNERVKSLARRDDTRAGRADLVAITERTLKLMKFRFRDAEVVVDVDLPQALPTAGSESRLEQIVFNLLGNAVEATGDRAGGRIRIAGGEDRGLVALEIHDNGSGLDPIAAGRLFEPFYTTKEAGQGLGLGLAISHRIALDHGGRLEVGRSPLGGAVFTLTLPALAAGDDAAPAKEIADERV